VNGLFQLRDSRFSKVIVLLWPKKIYQSMRKQVHCWFVWRYHQYFCRKCIFFEVFHSCRIRSKHFIELSENFSHSHSLALYFTHTNSHTADFQNAICFFAWYFRTCLLSTTYFGLLRRFIIRSANLTSRYVVCCTNKSKLIHLTRVCKQRARKKSLISLSSYSLKTITQLKLVESRSWNLISFHKNVL